MYLLDRIIRSGYSKIRPVGTLWSLYREQNHVHRAIVDKSKRRVEPYNRLPQPFETVIPNATAIADSSDPDKSPRSFKAKYTPAFAKLFEGLCEEIVFRTQWKRTEQETGAARLADAV